MQYTNDPNEVTRVWASFPLDAVFDGDRWDETSVFYDPREFRRIEERAYIFLGRRIHETFPNVTTVRIENTGWEGAWAQFEPKAETADGRIYEPFFDWLNGVQVQMSELGGFEE